MIDEYFLVFIRTMSKKGFHDVLNFVNENGPVQYNQIQKYAFSSKTVSCQSSVTIILNKLTHLGLLERSVVDGRHLGTKYAVSDIGKQVLVKFRPLQKLCK